MIPIRALARRVATALLLGAAAGGLFLGVGGRLVMRVFALTTTRSPAFSIGGTLQVVFAGCIAGALGGVLLVATERFFPKRLWLRGVSFAALCFLVASPGFRPPRPLVYGLFAPVFLGYALVLEVAWERLFGNRGPTGARS